MEEQQPGSSSPVARPGDAASGAFLSPPRTRAKERRNPSITPRKFRRFFTPRPRVVSAPSAARRALRDLAGPALNNRPTARITPSSSPLKPLIEVTSAEDGLQFVSQQSSEHPAKRRKVAYGTPPASSPVQQQDTPLERGNGSPHTPLSSRLLGSPIQGLSVELDDDDGGPSDLELADSDGDDAHHDRPLRQLSGRGMAGQLFQRELGCMPRPGRQFLRYPVCDWRSETENFYSRPEDVHVSVRQEGTGNAVPFCVASCNTNSLVAVGDEDGFVRLLDTCPSQNPDFSRVHLSFQTHGNAVIDVAFSEDDSLLGTASGDQLGKVFDMMTQTPIAVLSAHSASLKQIRFQPGAAMGKVLATSSRDGSVQIWDLRCRGPPVQEIVIEREERLGFRLPPKFQAGCIVNSMYGAHAPSRASTLRSSHALQALGGPAESGSSGAGDRPSRGEKPGRLGDVSVTAIQFLPAPGREHLLLTACEADASMKLWDVRAINNNYGSSGSSRGGHGRASAAYMPATPLAFTAPPPGHVAWRPFGITSIVLSTDGARAYALCKDNTVYAYSTQHLVLGHAPPEFAGSTLNFQGDDSAGAVASSSLYTHHHSRRRLTPAHEGLGPLYGLRHPLLHATSFYVKLALRPARHGHSELLAAGSSDGSAVLFPTDERWLFHSGPGRISDAAAATPTPIITHLGTPLVRGHTREVGALCFTASVSNPCETGGDRGGRLVTVADDFAIRRWSEHDVPGLAADLRSGGEGGGRRWQCGWAETRRGVWMGTEVFGDEAGAWSGDEIDEW